MPDEYEDILNIAAGKPAKPRVARPDVDSALDLIAKYESGDQNVRNYRYDPKHTAQGHYQITNTNWRNYGPRAGVDLNKYPSAMAAPKETQSAVAKLMFNERGFKDWAPFNPRLRAAIQQGEQGQTQDPYADILKVAAGTTSEQPPPSTEANKTDTRPVPAPTFWGQVQGRMNQPALPAPSIEDALQNLTSRVNQQTKALSRKAARTPKQVTGSSNLGLLKQADEAALQARQAQEQQVRQQVVEERKGRRGAYGAPTPTGMLHLISNPAESFTGLFRPEEENINREVAERLKQQQVASEPEVQDIRQEYGRMPAAVRTVAAPVLGRGGGGLLKTAGGVASLFGLAPNQLSEWANKRGEIIETASAMAPLDPQLKEIERSIPEKLATGAADLGVGIGKIILLKKATGLSFPTLLALEGAAVNSDKPIDQQLGKAAEGYALGHALDAHLGKTAGAALFGLPTAAQTGYEVSEGRMSPLDAAIQTGIQAGAGAILSPRRGGSKVSGPTLSTTEFPVGSRWRNPQWSTEGEPATVVWNDGRWVVIERGGRRLETTPEALRESVANGTFTPAQRGGLRERTVSDAIPERIPETLPVGEAPRDSQTLGPRVPVEQPQPAQPQAQGVPVLRTVAPRVEGQEGVRVGPETPNEPQTQLVPEQVLRTNHDILTSPEFRERILTESVGGNAGPGNVVVNGVVDSEGRVVSLGNLQDLSPEVRQGLENGQYTSISFIVGDALTSEPVVKQVLVHRSQPQPADIQGKWFMDLEDPSRSRGEIPPEMEGVRRINEPPVQTKPSVGQSGLTRSFRAGSNAGAVTFASELQRDLYDAGARIRRSISERGTRGVFFDRAKDPQLQSLAARLGVDVNEAFKRALDTHTDVKAQMKGVQDGETRQVKDNVQPPVEAQRAEVESAPRNTETVPTRPVVDREVIQVEPARGGEPETPQRFYHRDFGEVTESPNQKRVGKGRVRVTTEDGKEHIVKRPTGTGAGNQRAVPIKPEPEPANVGDVAPPKRWPVNPVTVRQEPVQRVRGGSWESQVVLDVNDLTPSIEKQLAAKAGGPLGSRYSGDTVELFSTYDTRTGAEGTIGRWREVVDKARSTQPDVGEVGAASPASTSQPITYNNRTYTKRDNQWYRDDGRRVGGTTVEKLEELAGKQVVEPQAVEQTTIAPEPSVTKPVAEAAPPLEPPEPPAPEARNLPSTTSIKNAATEQLRQDLDLTELPRPEKKAWETSIENARAKGLDKQVDKIADKIIEGEREIGLDLDESAALLVKIRELENKYEDIYAKNRNDPRLPEIEAQLDRYSKAVDMGGTEPARTLSFRKALIDKDFKRITVLRELKKAHGRDLTPREREQVDKWVAEDRQLAKQLEQAEQRGYEKALQEQFDKAARKRQRQQSKADLDAEAAQIREQLAQAFQKIKSQRGIQPSGLGPLDPEGEITKLLLKYVHNRVKANVGIRASELVDEAHELVKDIGATRRQVAEALAGYGRTVTDKRSEATKRLAELKAELRRELQAEDVAQGRRTTTRQGPPKPRDPIRQRELERQIASYEEQLRTGIFKSRVEREPPRYTKETYELQKRRDEIRSEYQKARYRAERGKWMLGVDTAAGAVNIPKTLLSMGDVSALLRQGMVGFVQHPIHSSRATLDMLKSFREAGYANVENAIKSDPDYQLAKKSGVEFTGVDKADWHLSHREEGYLGSDVIDQLAKIPVAGQAIRPVKAIKDVSERTFTSFLDSQRMRIFSEQANRLRSMNLTPKELKSALEATAQYTNMITGRGSLGERGNQAAPLLNMAMFSPRLLASRVQLLNKMFNPVAWARMPKGARRLQLEDNAKFLLGTAAILALAKAAGTQVNLDPDDADFLKIRVGNTRYDTLAGLQQPLRFMYRMSQAIKGGETYAGDPKSKILGDFARSKAAPGAGAAWDYLEGKNRLTGRKFNPKDLVVGDNSLLVPLPIKDFMETIKEDGALRGSVEAFPSLLGIGVQTYKDPAEKARTPAEKLARRFIINKMGDDEGRTQEEIDRDIAKSQLRARARRGEDVSADIEAMKAKITERQAKAILAARNKTRLQEDFNRLGAREAAIVYGVATPAQQAELKDLLQKKSALIDLLPLEQQEAVRQRYQALGMVPGTIPKERVRRERTERKPRSSGQSGYVFQ